MSLSNYSDMQVVDEIFRRLGDYEGELIQARAELVTRRENLDLCQKRLITTETERNTYRAALEEIRANYGHVCTEFELCEHPACNSSYGAWAVADEALRAARVQAAAPGMGETHDKEKSK